jgi:hypothetical protein
VNYAAIMVTGDVSEKRVVIWEAFQGEKWTSVDVEDIVVKVDLVDPVGVV